MRRRVSTIVLSGVVAFLCGAPAAAAEPMTAVLQSNLGAVGVIAVVAGLLGLAVGLFRHRRRSPGSASAVGRDDRPTTPIPALREPLQRHQ